MVVIDVCDSKSKSMIFFPWIYESLMWNGSKYFFPFLPKDCGWGGILVGLEVQSRLVIGFLILLESFPGLTFRLLVLREYSYLGVYLSAVTIWSMPFVLVSCC